MEIKLCNVSYDNLLEDFYYKFEAGKATGIIGNSFSGKSLIGSIIMGEVTLSSGSIKVNGKSDYDFYKFIRNIGYVSQKPWEQFVTLKVYDEIAFGLLQFKFKLASIDKQISNALLMVGLDDSYLERRVDTLSKGEAVLVRIASCLALNPKVLLIDDIINNLDFKARACIIELFRKIKDRYNKNIIILSSDVSFVLDFCDDYILLNDGCIVSQGSVSDLINCSDSLLASGLQFRDEYYFSLLARKRYNVNIKGSTCDDIIKDVIDNV